MKSIGAPLSNARDRRLLFNFQRNVLNRRLVRGRATESKVNVLIILWERAEETMFWMSTVLESCI